MLEPALLNFVLKSEFIFCRNTIGARLIGIARNAASLTSRREDGGQIGCLGQVAAPDGKLQAVVQRQRCRSVQLVDLALEGAKVGVIHQCNGRFIMIIGTQRQLIVIAQINVVIDTQCG